MGYTPPSGWVEELSPPSTASYVQRSTFHARDDCPRIRMSLALRAVDRPYSAARCSLCAAYT